MRRINNYADGELPRTAEEVYEEQKSTFLPENSVVSQSRQEGAITCETKEYIEQMIASSGGNTDAYEGIYHKHLYNTMPENVDSIVEKRLDYIQARIDQRIELCEAEGSYDVRDNEELVESITTEIKNSMEKQYADAAAISAYMEFQEYYENPLNEDKQSKLEAVMFRNNKMSIEEEKQKIIERFEAMTQNGELEYLVRGAPLLCLYGSHARHLDMYRSHGIYVNNKAVAFEEDCIVNKNISYFGHCNAPGCSLTEIISLKLGSVVNTDGVALQEVEDYIKVGIKCVPEFDGKWQNPHLTTLIAKDGGAEVFGDGLSPYHAALTTASYLICKQGGLIYPLTSGQIDEAYYYAAFQNYPFNDYGSEAFYKWCEMKDICPTIAGQPGHTQWHQKRIDNALTDFRLAKEKYENRYPENRVESNPYSNPLASLGASAEYKESAEYEVTRDNAQAAFECCLLDADRVGAANMSSEQAKKYGDILQDYLSSGILQEEEKKEVVSRYGEFLKVYRGARGITE
ncbi:MAG: PAAR-like protein [Lachnospiraceae bacterium]|nr:PAAR-like protein [Lachnospiraceae bacterium]